MRFTIMAFANGAFEEFHLPARNDADYEIRLTASRFGAKKDVLLKLEVISEVWSITETAAYSLRDEQGRQASFVLQDGLVLHLDAAGLSASLIVMGAPDALPGFQKFDISHLQRIRIGKQPECEICYDFRGLVSKVHAIMQRNGTQMWLEDTSTNGVFVNGERLRSNKQLSYGDNISILGLKLVYLGDTLAVYAGGRPLRLDMAAFRPFKQPFGAEEHPGAEETYFKRAPRVVAELHHEPVDIEAPPPPNRLKKQPLLLTIGPAFTMMIPMLLGSSVAIISANISGGATSAFMYTGIITAVSSALIGVMWAIVNLRYSKKQLKEDEAFRFNAYRDYLVKIADELKRKYNENAHTLRERYPSAEACLAYGPDPTRLWSRSMTHADFLFVRLGIGGMPFQVPIQVPKERFTLVDDSLADKPRQICNNFQTLRDVPVGIDLKEDMLWGIYGSGSMKEGLEIVRSMAVQLAANNCYTDVKLVFLYEKQHEKSLSFARWLPHVWSEDKKVRYIASDKNEVGDVLYALGTKLRIRAEQENKQGMPRPHYVVFVCNPDLLEGEPAAKFLLNPAPELGLSTLLIAPEYEMLPNACTNLVQWDAQFAGFYDVRTMEAQKRAVDFDHVEAGAVERFARWLSDMRVNEIESGGELSNSITFFDMHGVQSLQQFGVLDRWRKNRTYENMRALVGQKAGGANLYLDIHEKYHGPHGLIAGTTGSGKSETLQTYMLSLAINFSPLDIGFFVIDYKGGGMANLFSDLPHMLGQISNLSGNQVRRAMVSIKSEIKRRQRIFGEYDVNHLDQYTRLLKNREANVPIPHMVIVIDEFAELKREEPDFMRELISVAQVGRSLGIHLILATQKPAGTVDDNIWSNSKFRLCLRVQDRQDSMDMLKRADAAYITQAGRCYLQVGNDEIFELFQSGWSGAAYDEDYLLAKADMATMLSGTGQPSLVGNRSKLRLKEQKRMRWLGEILDAVTALPLENGGIDALLRDENRGNEALDKVFAHLEQNGYEYPFSQYNGKRIEDFMELLAQTGFPKSPEEKTAVLYAIQKRAALSGIKLPEIKEKTQLAAVVEYLKEQAVQNGMEAGLTLWLPVLPARLHLQELQGFSQQAFCESGRWAEKAEGREWELRAMVGLCDDPVNQAQTPVEVNFAVDGNIAVCGMAVSGKSTFLQTLLFSLANRYRPDAVQFYILDYSSRMLGCFSKLKHCGGIVFEDQAERAGKLFAWMKQELERRKKRFQGGNYAQYVRTHGLCEPALLLLIDGFANFKEKTDNRYEDILIPLSREGANYGMFLVLSAGGFSMAEIQNRIAENMKTVFCLQMGDRLKYNETMRTRVEVIPEADITGRGLAMVNGTALEFQTALSLPAEDDYKRGEAMAAVFERMNAAYAGQAARAIPEIPEKPNWQIFQEHPDYMEAVQSVDRLPLGYVQEDASLCSLNLRYIFTYLLFGQKRSGKTNTLRCLMQAVVAREGELTVIDGQSGELRTMAEELGARYVYSDEEIGTFARELFQEMIRRNALKRELRAAGASDDAMYDSMTRFRAQYLFVDDITELMQRLYGPAKEMQDIRGFMENFFDKGALHNMYVFAGLPQERYIDALGYEAFGAVAARKTGLLLGGDATRQQFLDFSSLPYAEQTKKFRPGIALLPPDQEREGAEKVVIPAAKA